VAAGGQGAPLAPVYHQALAAPLEKPIAILNLGGVGNVTWIGEGEPIAFDTGPGNGLIDDWVHARTGRSYDEGGRIAAAGRIDETRLAGMLAHPYLDQPPPKSLDRMDFTLAAVEGLGLEDGAATLAGFTVRAVARACEHLPARPKRWLITGGGRHNATLMRMLAHALAVPVEPIEAIGADGDALEAQAFAFLAVRTLRGLPISFPATTGAPRPLCGGRLVPAGGAARGERRW
jgi:anhydro-N-acetylmuramic acid kinase